MPQSEERALRIAAVAAYLSYFVLPWIGPLLLLLLIGRKSGFVRFHSVQAFNVQITCTAIEIVGIVAVMFFSGMNSAVSYVFMVALAAFGVAAIVLAVSGAIQSARGRMDRYPVWVALRWIQ